MSRSQTMKSQTNRSQTCRWSRWGGMYTPVPTASDIHKTRISDLIRSRSLSNGKSKTSESLNSSLLNSSAFNSTLNLSSLNISVSSLGRRDKQKMENSPSPKKRVKKKNSGTGKPAANKQKTPKSPKGIMKSPKLSRQSSDSSYHSALRSPPVKEMATSPWVHTPEVTSTSGQAPEVISTLNHKEIATSPWQPVVDPATLFTPVSPMGDHLEKMDPTTSPLVSTSRKVPTPAFSPIDLKQLDPASTPVEIEQSDTTSVPKEVKPSATEGTTKDIQDLERRKSPLLSSADKSWLKSELLVLESRITRSLPKSNDTSTTTAPSHSLPLQDSPGLSPIPRDCIFSPLLNPSPIKPGSLLLGPSPVIFSESKDKPDPSSPSPESQCPLQQQATGVTNVGKPRTKPSQRRSVLSSSESDCNLISTTTKPSGEIRPKEPEERTPQTQQEIHAEDSLEIHHHRHQIGLGSRSKTVITIEKFGSRRLKLEVGEEESTTVEEVLDQSQFESGLVNRSTVKSNEILKCFGLGENIQNISDASAGDRAGIAKTIGDGSSAAKQCGNKWEIDLKGRRSSGTGSLSGSESRLTGDRSKSRKSKKFKNQEGKSSDPIGRDRKKESTTGPKFRAPNPKRGNNRPVCTAGQVGGSMPVPTSVGEGTTMAYLTKGSMPATLGGGDQVVDYVRHVRKPHRVSNNFKTNETLTGIDRDVLRNKNKNRDCLGAKTKFDARKTEEGEKKDSDLNAVLGGAGLSQECSSDGSDDQTLAFEAWDSVIQELKEMIETENRKSKEEVTSLSVKKREVKTLSNEETAGIRHPANQTPRWGSSTSNHHVVSTTSCQSHHTPYSNEVTPVKDIDPQADNDMNTSEQNLQQQSSQHSPWQSTDSPWDVTAWPYQPTPSSSNEIKWPWELMHSPFEETGRPCQASLEKQLLKSRESDMSQSERLLGSHDVMSSCSSQSSVDLWRTRHWEYLESTKSDFPSDSSTTVTSSQSDSHQSMFDQTGSTSISHTSTASDDVIKSVQCGRMESKSPIVKSTKSAVRSRKNSATNSSGPSSNAIAPVDDPSPQVKVNDGFKVTDNAKTVRRSTDVRDSSRVKDTAQDGRLKAIQRSKVRSLLAKDRIRSSWPGVRSRSKVTSRSEFLLPVQRSTVYAGIALATSLTVFLVCSLVGVVYIASVMGGANWEKVFDWLRGKDL